MEGGPTRWRKVSDTVAGFLRADGKLAPIYAICENYTLISKPRYDGDAVTYEFEIPANLTADVTLPDGRKLTLAPGKHIV